MLNIIILIFAAILLAGLLYFENMNSRKGVLPVKTPEYPHLHRNAPHPWRQHRRVYLAQTPFGNHEGARDILHRRHQRDALRGLIHPWRVRPDRTGSPAGVYGCLELL
ncbi:hypothetical protein M1N85_05005, partial [Dehalococcoidia bacterium]|nr:hypothetical protein [Dehalococcoidia bacterium]